MDFFIDKKWDRDTETNVNLESVKSYLFMLIRKWFPTIGPQTQLIGRGKD